MKYKDIPREALAAEPTHPPMKLVLDHDAIARLLTDKPWLVLRVDPSQDRITNIGAVESPAVKAVNNHVRITLKRRLLTKRIAPDAWFLMLTD